MIRLMKCAVLLPALVLVMGANGWISRVAAVDDQASVQVGEDVMIDVLANDGVLGPDLQLVRVSGTPSRGIAQVDGQQVRYSAFADAAPGVDEFSYAVRRANGAVAAGRVRVEVTGVPDPITVTFWGTAIGDVHPTCDVAIVIGAERFDTCLNEPGMYGSSWFTQEITTTDPVSVAVLEATLSRDDQPHPTRYRSVMRSVPGMIALTAEYGFDNYVGHGAYGGLHLSSYNTVNHALLVAEHGEGIFANEAALAQAELGLDAQRLHAFTMVFEALVRGRVDLPEGYVDAYAVVSDIAAAEAIYYGPLFPLLGELQQEVLDEWLVDLPTLHETLPFVLSSYGGANSNINVARYEGLQLHPESVYQGRMYGYQHKFDTSFHWGAFGKGRWLIEETEPRTVTTTVWLNCAEGTEQFELVLGEWLEAMSKVIDGVGADVSVLHIRSEALNTDDFPPGCTHVLAEPRQGAMALHTFGPAHVLDFGPVAQLGRVAVRTPRLGPSILGMDSLSAGIVDFAEGIIDAPGLMPGISVSPNGRGGLNLQMQADTSGGFQMIEMRLFRTRVDGRGGEQWLGYADSPTAGGIGLGGVVARETKPDLFAGPGAVSGTWESSFALHDEGRHLGPQNRLYFDFPEGTGQAGVRYLKTPQGVVTTLPFSWEVNGAGHLVMQTFQSLVDWGVYAHCPDQCYVWQRRVWEPLSASPGGEAAERIYMIEEISVGSPEQPEPALASRRVNYYDAAEVPVPPEPVAPVVQPSRMRR